MRWGVAPGGFRLLGQGQNPLGCGWLLFLVPASQPLQGIQGLREPELGPSWGKTPSHGQEAPSCFPREGQHPGACWLSDFSLSDSLRPYRAWPSRLLYPWDSLGKKTRTVSHALLQGIFLTQG